MEYSREIREAVERLSGTFGKDHVAKILCTVSSVDYDDNGKPLRTCSVFPVTGDTDTEIPDVKLMANSNDGMLLIPTIDSEVIVTFIKKKSDLLCYVSMFSELDEVYIITNTITQLNNGSFGGLVKVSDLTTKLNNLVSEVNTELTKIQAAITSLGGTYSKAPASDFNESDYKNDRITHGI